LGIFDRAIVSPQHSRIGKTARGDDIRVIARASDTNGALGIWSSVIAPGTGPTWHTHSRETEVFHVLSGSFRFWCGSEVFEVEAGGTVVLPPNVPHQWINTGSTPGEMFSFVTPGGFEQNFLDLGGLDTITDDAVAAIETRLGVTDGP
jgi:mannose-6-phosphate isomerase-like protein (cupin superfamily)